MKNFKYVQKQIPTYLSSPISSVFRISFIYPFCLNFIYVFNILCILAEVFYFIYVYIYMYFQDFIYMSERA